MWIVKMSVRNDYRQKEPTHETLHFSFYDFISSKSVCENEKFTQF